MSADRQATTIRESLATYRERYAAVDDAARERVDDAATIDLVDFVRLRDAMALAHASGILSYEAAMVLYAIAETWDTRPSPDRAVWLTCAAEVLAAIERT